MQWYGASNPIPTFKRAAYILFLWWFRGSLSPMKRIVWFPHPSVWLHTEAWCLMCPCWGWAVAFHEKVLRLTKTQGFQAFCTLNMVAEVLCSSRFWLIETHIPLHPRLLFVPVHFEMVWAKGIKFVTLSRPFWWWNKWIRNERPWLWKYLASHYSFL